MIRAIRDQRMKRGSTEAPFHTPRAEVACRVQKIGAEKGPVKESTGGIISLAKGQEQSVVGKRSQHFPDWEFSLGQVSTRGNLVLWWVSVPV